MSNNVMQQIKLGDVGKIETGTTPSKANSEYYGDDIPLFKPNDLEQGINTIAAMDKLSLEGYEKTRKLPKNTILVTCIGATIGKAGLSRVEGASNQQINAIIPNKDHDPKFVYYQIISTFLQNQIKKNASSTTLPILNKTKFQQLLFITAPLPIQQAIVAKLEALFSELDKGIEQLKTAQQQLRTYRQAVLKAAFEGKLTGEQVKEGILPEGWQMMTIGSLSPRVTVGHVGSMKNEYIKSGIPFLRSQNVRTNRYDPQGLQFISSEFHDQLSKSKIQPGDILVVRSGNVGTSCVVPESLKEANCSDLVIIKKPRLASSQFICYYINSVIETKVKAGQVGVALTHFNTKSVQNLEIPIPPLDKQTQIVSEIESRLSVADKLEETIAQGLQQTEALRQSILKKAFEGELIN